MRTRRIFVAGSTGATGRVLMPMARARGLDVMPHVRPKSAANAPAGAAVFDLTDAAALERALADCTTVISLIGTMRKRFAAGDTYQSSDIDTARRLAQAAKKAGVDHFILLSSVGAGKPVGAYLKAKAQAEACVREAGVPWTVFRPSSLEGGERHAPPLMGALTRALGLERFAPITLEQLSAAMLKCAAERAPLDVALEGAPLFALAAG